MRDDASGSAADVIGSVYDVAACDGKTTCPSCEVLRRFENGEGEHFVG